MAVVIPERTIGGCGDAGPVARAAPRRITKQEREAVRLLFGGLCAYCGRNLPARWHVDHLEPVMRVALTGFYSDGLTMLHPERDVLANYMPACPPCNIDKHRMSLERWREWLAVRLGALRKSPGWRLLSAHGLVVETGEPVVFHFERATLAVAPVEASPRQVPGEGSRDAP